VSESQVQNSADRLIGETLQNLRISRGIPLEEVARVTRIGKGYLAAIEEGHLDKLPSGAYSRGFIRQYAQFLGLGEAEIADLLAPPPQERGADDRVSPEKRVAQREPRTRKVKAKGNWLVSALLLAIVALIALVTGDRRPDPPVKTSASAGRALQASEPSAIKQGQLPVSSARREPVAQPAAPATGAKLAVGQQDSEASDGVVLRLKVTHDSWLTMTIDNALTQQYELKSGDVIEWKGERSFMLDVGNGAAFEGEFNGKPIQPLGEAGKPAHVVLKADAQDR
jgi:cytoskeletal protein RodZ